MMGAFIVLLGGSRGVDTATAHVSVLQSFCVETVKMKRAWGGGGCVGGGGANVAVRQAAGSGWRRVPWRSGGPGGCWVTGNGFPVSLCPPASAALALLP